MRTFGRAIAKYRILVLIISLILLIPAGISYINTRVNYDILYYLPDDIDTMKGQDKRISAIIVGGRWSLRYVFFF